MDRGSLRGQIRELLDDGRPRTSTEILREIACGHRVYGHESKCAHLHGHNYGITFTCEGKQDDINELDRLLPWAQHWVIISLQPLSLSVKATKLCVDTAIARGWRVSVQQHRYMAIR